jgi:hypothetical protein
MKACSNWFQKSWHAVQWRGTLTFKKYLGYLVRSNDYKM